MPRSSTPRLAIPRIEAASRQPVWRQLCVAWLLAICACGAQAMPEPAKVRCGWFENPTPANAWLTDRDGDWIIAVQGGHQGNGDWPAFPHARWVRTNGNYGYGCACIKLLADPQTGLVQGIVSSYSLPLQSCRKDRALTEPHRD
jgi:uncharacterized protein DUF4087